MLPADRFRLSCVVAALLIMGTATPTLAQTPAKEMTPARLAWLQARCAQLVAFFDYYGADRGEHSDGSRNHMRIGAAIECSRGNYWKGIKMMAALLKARAFDLPKPGTPAIEPEDIYAPDITNPTRQRY